MRRDITFTAALETQVAFKNCAVVTLRITNVDEITIDETEDLDIVMPIYNLYNIVQIILKHQDNYGFILRIRQLILMQILAIQINLNLSNIRLNY